jgi:pimeloyl-ACP methyl ester carboxylesterase
MNRDILFIHGAWVTPLCWESFQGYFQQRGYATQAPPWPGKDASIEAQKAGPSRMLEGLGIGEIVDHYREILARSPRPPILIGHSFGGLFVQLLLAQGLGTAGVAIDSAPPKGIFAFYPSAFRSLARVLTTWVGWRRILRMPYSDFEYAFLNTVPPDKRRGIYERFVVPETGRVFFQAALSIVSPASPARIDFSQPRAPLLLIAGGSDHIVPPAINRANFRKYRRSPAITAFKEFPGRGHWIIAQENWQEVADFTAAWLESLGLEDKGAAA